MYRVPRFIRRFRKMLTMQDLLTGRKVAIKDNINNSVRIEKVKQ